MNDGYAEAISCSVGESLRGPRLLDLLAAESATLTDQLRAKARNAFGESRCDRSGSGFDAVRCQRLAAGAILNAVLADRLQTFDVAAVAEREPFEDDIAADVLPLLRRARWSRPAAQRAFPRQRFGSWVSANPL